MESVCENNKCTGCGACEQKCPKQCIFMKNDSNGFAYPCIDQDNCINCGLCSKICPENNLLPLRMPVKVFKSKSVLTKDIDKTSSGGTVSAIVSSFIQNGGSVFASTFDKDLNVSVKKIISLDDLEKMKGSKYVQSSMVNSFREVLSELNQGKRVLFIGTPCQVAGLCSFIGKPIDNLYTIDLLCAGVSSPVVFKKYIESLRETYGYFDNINFRDKKYGYGFYVTSIIINNKKKILKGEDNGFSECIGHGLIRISCMECTYHRRERIGDLTIGDYGTEHITNDERRDGVNILFLNTSKGQALLEMVNKNIIFNDADAEAIKSKYHSTPLNPSKRKVAPKYYDKFFAAATELGWKDAYKKYIRIKGMRGIIKRIVPQQLYYWLHR